MASARAVPAGSRALFQHDDGSPMRFYVRPGPAKVQLAPLILAGGGRLCRLQEPGAVLLAQPGERVAAGNFVSTEYVRRCVESNERLPLERYRLAAAPAPSLGVSLGGRSAFTAAEDEAILLHVREQTRGSVRGTALWKEMERARLTPHSWQAMRDRYLRHLRGQEHKYLLHSGAAESWRKKAADVSQEVAQDKLTEGFFQLANQEFEGSESENETVGPQEENPAKVEDLKSPETTASSQKIGLKELATAEDSAVIETPQEEEETIRSCPSPTEVADAVKTVQHFMEEFSVDLSTVTQAFLKNSGEVEATSYFLQTSHHLDGYPIWSRQDDLDLQKADENVRNKLIAKFGAQNVLKRVAFRKS
ncbi:telomeric repeat-binding factor 2-interacting protein 1 isoform X1 [Carettochelys insculpta]|uniref:telomeric repeat-binding factor 2-interacting protein 1 isoform X1 n=1 Tax=Carettochelys insculpta TaxID=44489 RepID=UPI003EBDCF01